MALRLEPVVEQEYWGYCVKATACCTPSLQGRGGDGRGRGKQHMIQCKRLHWHAIMLVISHQHQQVLSGRQPSLGHKGIMAAYCTSPSGQWHLQ